MDILATGAVATGYHISQALAEATLASWAVTASLGGYMLRTWLVRGGLRRRRATGAGPPPQVIFGHFGLAVIGLLAWAAFTVTRWDVLAWAGGLSLLPAVGLGISTLTLWTPYPVAQPAPAPRGAPGPLDAPPAAAVRAPGHPDGGNGVATSGMLATPAEDILARKLTDDVLARALTDDALAGRLADMVLANVSRPEQAPARRSRGHLAALVPVGHGLAAVITILLVMMSLGGSP